MNIELRISNAGITQLLRRYVARRLHFALGRFGDRVGQVSVKLHGDVGRGIDSKCRMTAEVRPFGAVSVDERDPDLFAAIDRAAGRLGRRFSRELGRVQDLRSGRQSIRDVA